MRKILLLTGTLLLMSLPTWGQDLSEILLQEPPELGEGWRGFADIGFLVNAFLTLTLAAILGAIVAYHPKNIQTADTLEEIEAPKVFILYTVIGGIIGMMVVKYGLVVGFVLFGIGGLIRFRTVMRSPNLTGQVIFVTLIGLSCGLNLPHVAALSTLFGFLLIYVLDARVTYRIDVRTIPKDRVVEAAAAYREVLERNECRIMSEKKNPERARITFIFQAPSRVRQDVLESTLETQLNPSLKGTVDWEVD